MTYVLLAAAAAAFLLWPAKSKDLVVPGPFTMAGQARVQPHPTYQASLTSLAEVRLRLLQTEQLDDDRRAAIDSLTLALVAGSDKE